MAKTKTTTISQYIASKPADVRPILRQVRETIRKAVPGAEEGISYQIPVFKLKGLPVLYFAGWKNHYSLYPAGEPLVAAFKDELKPYELSKGTIRFPFSEPIPRTLIARIAKFRVKDLREREQGKRGKSGREGSLERVRRICRTLPAVSEKISHGAPTFFVENNKGAFMRFAADHHQDGHLAVWVPVPPGLQSALIEDEPSTYFKPPYVGASGWVGIELDRINDEALTIHIRKAWELASNKKKSAR